MFTPHLGHVWCFGDLLLPWTCWAHTPLAAWWARDPTDLCQAVDLCVDSIAGGWFEQLLQWCFCRSGIARCRFDGPLCVSMGSTTARSLHVGILFSNGRLGSSFGIHGGFSFELWLQLCVDETQFERSALWSSSQGVRDVEPEKRLKTQEIKKQAEKKGTKKHRTDDFLLVLC